MLDTYVNAAQHRMQINLKTQDLIVTLTKGDLLSSKISDELGGYLTSGTADKYEKILTDKEVGSNELIRAIFTKRAGGFVNMAEKHFKSVNYTILSSTGAKTSGVKSIAPIVISDPKRVLDPFIQLIHFVKCERQRFLKKRAVKIPAVEPIIKSGSCSSARKSFLLPPMVKLAGGAAVLLITVFYFALVSNSSRPRMDIAPAPAAEPQGAHATAPEPGPIATQTAPPAEESPVDLYENGLAYLFGRKGFEKNSAKAAEQFLKAAQRDYVKAQYNLALMLVEGNGVPKDTSEALKWFLKAAQSGDADAQMKLGELHIDGVGVSPDYAEAAKWYRKAAISGVKEAQYVYGMLLIKGMGIAKDNDEGLRWLKKSAAKGYSEAKDVISKIETSREQ